MLLAQILSLFSISFIIGNLIFTIHEFKFKCLNKYKKKKIVNNLTSIFQFNQLN